MKNRTWSERWLVYQANHARPSTPFLYLFLSAISAPWFVGVFGSWSAFLCGFFLLGALLSWERLGCQRLLERVGPEGLRGE